MAWHEILSWVITAVSFIAAWIYKNRLKLVEAASIVALYVEKHHGDRDNEDMDALAQELAAIFFPGFKATKVAPIIRFLCSRRKKIAAANGSYLDNQQVDAIDDDGKK